MKANRFFLMIVILAVVLLAACAGSGTEQPPAEAQAPAETQPQVEVTAVPLGTEVAAPEIAADVPEGWTTFADPTYNYAFAYPAEWEVCNEGEGNIQLCKPMEEPGVGPKPSFYVAVIPKGVENSPYDAFTAEGVRRYMGLKVGESELSEPDAQPAEYFRYTRLPDAQGWDFRAMMIENERVWEAPQEIKDRRALVMTEAGIFILGSYYASPEDLQTYEQILSTFEFKR
jgi:predicted small lipoprotein YifL